MPNFDNFMQKTSDWRVTSYGELGVTLGIGGKVTHFIFQSPTLRQKLNTIFIENGVGAELKINLDVISAVDKLVSGLSKAVDTYNSITGWTKLFCYRPFSRWDIMGALAGGYESSISSICGIKVNGLLALKNKTMLFSIPSEVSPSFGIGGGASAKVGFFWGIDSDISRVYMRDKYDNENKVRKSARDPFPRQIGGF